MKTINISYPEVGWMKERFQVTELNDQLCEFHWTMYPGGGVPEHYHEESDELFQVLEGTLTFRVNGKTSVLGPGEELLVPRLAVHSISNKSGASAKAVVTFKPVADQGKFFQICMFLAHENPNDKNPVFKALYISHKLRHKPFSSGLGAMKVVEDLMMGVLKLIGPLLGWNELVKRYAVLQETELAILN